MKSTKDVSTSLSTKWQDLAVQNEIRTMNETLCVLTNEIKHTNLHLERHERKLDEMEAQPSKRLHQIVTALISSICGALITTVIALMFG